MKGFRTSGNYLFFPGCLAALLIIVAATYDRTNQPYQLKYPAYFGNRFVVPEDNPMTLEGVKLGRLLFYEERLSRDNSMSCASCHQQKLAFTDGLAFSPGVDKTLTQRNSMSLTNLLWIRNYFWDGRSSTLEIQAIVPMTDPHEMSQSLEASAAKLQATKSYPGLFQDAFGSGRITGENIIKAISQFERTLISSNSRYDRYLRGEYVLTGTEQAGMDLFMNASIGKKRSANCGHCHGSPKLMVELFHNNGLDKAPRDPGREGITKDVIDRGRFRVPTLRNIALTSPYMHDGRFKTLDEVLDHYSEHIAPSETLSSFIKDSTNLSGARGLLLTPSEKKNIVTFLEMLTDSTFINDPAFSDPRLPIE